METKSILGGCIIALLAAASVAAMRRQTPLRRPKTAKNRPRPA